MALYLFPIFCFGLVMTGIVFVGVRRATEHHRAEQKKRLAELDEAYADQGGFTPSRFSHRRQVSSE